MSLPKCAVGGRKEECGADGEMKGAADGLTPPKKASFINNSTKKC